jgi:ATP synthase protein I
VLKAAQALAGKAGSRLFMENDIKKTIRTVGYLSTTGMAMGISIAIGAWLGFYLMKKFHTGIWLFLVFLLFGIIAAFKNLLFMARKARIEDQKSE